MASHYEAPIRRPLITGDKSYHDVTVDVAAPVEGKANRSLWIVFSIALAALLWGIGCIIYTISTGIGVWGLNKTVNWNLCFFKVQKNTRYKFKMVSN